MFRDSAQRSRVLGVAAVLVISLIVAWVSFEVVSRANASIDAAARPGPSSTAAGTSTPGSPATTAGPRPSAKPSSVSGKLKPKWTAANGQLLWAPAPLTKLRQDQGISMPLPDGRTLWIFADTFQRKGTPNFFHTSSAAVSVPGSWQLTYTSSKGVPTEFLARTAAEKADVQTGSAKFYEAIWPTGATQLPDGRILVSYAKYRVYPNQTQFTFLGAGLFTYRYKSVGAFLDDARATRIADDIWAPSDGEVRSPVYSDGYVYFDQCQDLVCYPVRVTVSKLGKRGSYTWLTPSGWSHSSLDRQPISVASGHPGGNAAVVQLSSGLYAMADTEVGAPSRIGLLWVSKNPFGPWSPAAQFYFPMCPVAGCYGLNLHPETSTSSTLRVSYATEGGPYVRVYDVPVSISADGSAIRVR
jgi:hypothetical protein